MQPIIFETQDRVFLKKSAITDATGLQNTQYAFVNTSQTLTGHGKWLQAISNHNGVSTHARDATGTFKF